MVEVGFRDGLAWVLGVAGCRGKVKVYLVEVCEPGEEHAGNDGGLDQACLDRGPAVEMGENLLSGLSEEVD